MIDIEQIKKEFNINIEIDSIAYKILEIFYNNDLLNFKLLKTNEELYICINALLEEKYYNSICFLFGAVTKEYELGSCLALESFSKWGNPEIGLFNNNKIDSDKIQGIYNAKYSHYVNLGNFKDKTVENFVLNNLQSKPSELPFLYFKILSSFCGCSDIFLESFFQKEFQEFLKIGAHFILYLQESDYEKSLNLIYGKNERLDDTKKNEITEADFDEFVKKNEKEFIDFLTNSIIEFSKLRRITNYVIESHLEVLVSDNYNGIKGNSNIQLLTFQEFSDDLLMKVIDDKYPLNSKERVAIKKYLELDYSKIKEKNGGFLSLVKRQHNLFIKYNKVQSGSVELKPIDDATTEDIEKVIVKNEELLNDLATVHRLKFVLDNLHLITDIDELTEIHKKIAEIVNSSSSTYFSDIFELYLGFLLRYNNVKLSFLISQKDRDNLKSTCDYKIENNITADCKCHIGNSFTLSNISNFCKTICNQIESTIGYQSIEFGGGIIGVRDNNFEVLNRLKKYIPSDKSIESKAPVINFIIETYSEIRKNIGADVEKIKFILFYYLPNANIEVEEIFKNNKNTKTEENELFFLFTTKYATENEVIQIEKAFEGICPLIFKFNNYFNN